MAVDQELVDLRELLFRQGQQLSDVADLLRMLVQGIASIEMAPIITLPEVRPEVVIREQDPAILVEAVQRSFSPPMAALAEIVAGMRENIEVLADKITQGPPTIIRGGGGGLGRADLDASTLAKDQTVQSVVTAVEAIESGSSRIASLIKFEPSEGEEIRRDETLTDDYHGAAPDGTATSAASWDVVRFYKTASKITRVRFRTGVSWDSRTVGW